MSALPGSTRDELEIEFALRMSILGTQNLKRICEHIHRLNASFYRNFEGKRIADTPEFSATKIALMHSELSEMLEGLRTGIQDKHLPARLNEEVEAADLFIRLADYCAWRGFDLAGAIADKLRYNATREDHTTAARLAANGKKF